MKAGTFELMRVWAVLTGLALVVVYFAALALGHVHIEQVAMLATAIGGFEMVLFGQDLTMKRKRKHG